MHSGSHSQLVAVWGPAPGFHCAKRILSKTWGLGKDAGSTRPLTILPVEANFSLVLLMALQGLVQPLQGWLTGFWTIEEMAAARFLHDLSATVACELTEAVRAVDDGKASWALCIGQQEVAVCGEEEVKVRSRSGGELSFQVDSASPKLWSDITEPSSPGFHVIPGSRFGLF